MSLKVSKALAERAAGELALAPPLRMQGAEPQSLWVGPDHWFLLSMQQRAEWLIALCKERLRGFLHIAVDYSSAVAAFQLQGPAARQLLATGSCLDFNEARFSTGSCCRTRLAQIAAIITVTGPDDFELYVDRSYEAYLFDWLSDSIDMATRLENDQT